MVMVPPYVTNVSPHWIDYNNHMTEGYYGIVFADATDAMLDYVGMDAAYRAADLGTMYTVETHIRFLRELKVGQNLRVEVTVIGSDRKRLHLWSELHAAGYLAATQEVLLVHVIPSTGRVGEMSEATTASIARYRAERQPEGLGRSIRPIEDSTT